MAKTKEQIREEKDAQLLGRREADDYWWLIVRTPAQEIHVYELGYAESGFGALTEERHAQIMAELGAPDRAAEHGWDMAMAPGRPERYLEPKAHDPVTGDLLPIKARAGVTLHLAPESEPGVPEDDSEE